MKIIKHEEHEWSLVKLLDWKESGIGGLYNLEVKNLRGDESSLFTNYNLTENEGDWLWVHKVDDVVRKIIVISVEDIEQNLYSILQ